MNLESGCGDEAGSGDSRRLKRFGDRLWLPLLLAAVGWVLWLALRLCIQAPDGPWPVVRFAAIALIVTAGPGLFWLRILRVFTASAADRLLLALVASIGTTAWLCWTAYFLGVYRQGVLFAILAILAAAGLYGSLGVDWAAAARWPAGFWRRQGGLARLMIVFLLWFALEQLAACAGVPFSGWDAMVSWDKWGCDMAGRRGLGSHVMGGYPQLLPTLYSVFYKAAGTWASACADEQMLLHGWGLVFPLVLAPAVYRLCRLLDVRWEPALAVALGFAGMRESIPSGYADVPLAALVVAALALTLALLRGEWHAGRCGGGALLLGLSLFAMAFVKGPGMVWLLGMPVFACAWGGRQAPGRTRVLSVIGGVLMALASVGPFYAHEFYYSRSPSKAEADPRLHSFAMQMGHPNLLKEDRGVGRTLQVFGQGFLGPEGRGRAKHAAAGTAAILGALVLAGLFRREVWPLAVVGAVATAVWWRTAAYDWRNVLPSIAVVGVLAGAGAGVLRDAWPRPWRASRWLAVAGPTAFFGLTWFIATIADSRILGPRASAQSLIVWQCARDWRWTCFDPDWLGLKRFLDESPPGRRAQHVYCSDPFYRFVGTRGIYGLQSFAYTELTKGDLFVERFAKAPAGFDVIGAPGSGTYRAWAAYQPDWQPVSWTIAFEDASQIDLRLDDLAWARGDWMAVRVRLERGEAATADWCGTWDTVTRPEDTLGFAAHPPGVLAGAVWWRGRAERWEPRGNLVCIRRKDPATRVIGVEAWVVKGP